MRCGVAGLAHVVSNVIRYPYESPTSAIALWAVSHGENRLTLGMLWTACDALNAREEKIREMLRANLRSGGFRHDEHGIQSI
jgi:hypothetical protein